MGIVSPATIAAYGVRGPVSANAVVTAIFSRATAESTRVADVPARTIGTPLVVNTPKMVSAQKVFEQVLTATLAADVGAPILVYTYTQQINANGEHIVAACIWNLGTAAATDVEVQFDARAPALFTAVRIPSEQSELGDQQVKIRIASLSPKALSKIEVVVMHADSPLPDWVSVGIPQAYALDHPGDPPFPVPCTSTNIQSVAPKTDAVNIEVGGLYATVNDAVRAEPERSPNRNPPPVAKLEQGPPAFSSAALYCLIGLILAVLLVIGLLSGERNKRAKPPRRRQRVSA